MRFMLSEGDVGYLIAHYAHMCNNVLGPIIERVPRMCYPIDLVWA